MILIGLAWSTSNPAAYKEMNEVNDRILRKTERAAVKYKADEHEGSGGSGED